MKIIVICAWYGKFIRFKRWQGNKPPTFLVSHSICAACKGELDEEINDIEGGDHETQYKRGVA
jgi:hypothetical protein